MAMTSNLGSSSLMGSLITSRLGDETLFECPICQEPYDYAVETPCCGKCYCRECIKQWLDKSSDCPECRQTIANSEACKPNRAIQRLINSLPTPCPNTAAGCTEVISRGNVESHRPKCMYEPVHCKWSKQCGLILRIDLLAHEKDLCLYKPSTCPKCDEPLAEMRLLPDHLTTRCPMVLVECLECKKQVARGEMTQHILECPERREECPYTRYGCTTKEKRYAMPTHLDESVAFHLQLVEQFYERERSVISEEADLLRKFIVTLRPQLRFSPLVTEPVLLPSRIVTDIPNAIAVEADYEAIFKGGLFVSNKAASAKMVRGDVPIPFVNAIYYFEVTVLHPLRGGEIGVGLAEVGHNMDGMPGWTNGCFGFHGDDGNLFHTDFGTKGQKYSVPFGKGDTIGLGWDQRREFVYYTKNGELLGVAFGAVSGAKEYYPVVGMHTVNARARVNFGAEPFVYKHIHE